MVDTHSRYTVGGRVFYSKTQALIEATASNTFPEWSFANDVFSKLEWGAGGGGDIRDVYKKRAIQLRDSYDYLILNFSGGSDSWTVLQSFISAGVLLDEIQVIWPVKATEGKYSVSAKVTDTWNILSEYDLIIKPDLEFIANYYPNIKISVVDWSDDIYDELVESDWYRINDHLNPGVFRKYAALGPNEQKISDSGKRVATIWGVDKPQLAYKDGNIYFYFLDKLANTRSVHGTSSRNNELFYWTPELPELVHAQARLAYEYFVKNPSLTKLIEWGSNRDKHSYDMIIRTLVYPDWDANKFQAKKADSSTYCMVDGWMFKSLQDHRYLQSWQHGLDNIRKAVSPKYHQVNKDGRFDGWIGFISPFYKLGPVYNID